MYVKPDDPNGTIVYRKGSREADEYFGQDALYLTQRRQNPLPAIGKQHPL